MFLCICTIYPRIVLMLHMEIMQVTHHEFQLLIGAAGAIGFFAFAGIVYFIHSLTSKNK